MLRSRTILAVLGALSATCAPASVAEDADGGSADAARRDAARDGAARGDASADDAGSPWRAAVPLPDPPEVPEAVELLTITALTLDDTVNNAADRSDLELCVTDSLCAPVFRSDREQLNEGRRAYRERLPGGENVYYVDVRDLGVTLPRTALDRFVVRHVSGTEWRPSCLSLRADGEPLYCSPIDMMLGDGDTLDDELVSRCGSCYGGPEAEGPSAGGTLTHGPTLGPATDDSVSLWVRADATRLVTVSMATREDFGDAVRVAAAYPSAEADFTQRFVVSSLEPDTTYFYRVEVDGEPVTDVAPIRTARAGEGEYRFVLASCARRGTARGNVPAGPPFTLGDYRYQSFDKLLEAPIGGGDLFVYLGDIHYGNTTELEDLRWNYRVTRGDRYPLHSRIPTIAVWDDHDFGGSNPDRTIPGAETSLRVFEEYFANPRPPDADGIYFRHRHGDVEFFGLDTRFHRPPIPDSGETDEPLLGEAQTEWLLDALERSTASFKVLLSGSRFTRTAQSRKSWGPYAPSREALFRELHARRIEGVVLVSGGPHRSEVRVLEREEGYPLVEIIASTLSAHPSECPAADPEVRRCVGKEDDVTHRSLAVLEVSGTGDARQLRVRLFSEGPDRVVREPVAPYEHPLASLRY